MNSGSLPLARPSQYLDAVVDTIKGAVADRVRVSTYESWGTNQLADYQILVELGPVRLRGYQNDGRHGLLHEVVVYAVVSSAVESAEKIAVNMAVSLMRLVHDQHWGLRKDVDTPADANAAPSFLMDKADDHRGYEAWEVQFEQIVYYGESGWATETGLPGFMLAVNPVDDADIAEYQPIEGVP